MNKLCEANGEEKPDTHTTNAGSRHTYQIQNEYR